jgi:hypothetical protein
MRAHGIRAAQTTRGHRRKQKPASAYPVTSGGSLRFAGGSARLPAHESWSSKSGSRQGWRALTIWRRRAGLRVRLPGVWGSLGVGAGAPSFVAVLGVRVADLCDDGDRDAQDTHAAANVVGYAGLTKFGYEHRPRSQRAAQPGEQLLPRAHRAVSNPKTWIHGTHRDVSNEHLPVYLSMSTCSATTAATHQWPRSRLYSGSQDAISPPPTASSPPTPTKQPEQTGYALAGFSRSG